MEVGKKMNQNAKIAMVMVMMMMVLFAGQTIAITRQECLDKCLSGCQPAPASRCIESCVEECQKYPPPAASQSRIKG
ncbi:non-transporter ABC protein [Corchorus olitorius]|uniref:Non-transporter ABC protein n=1 Tax=Corchorus olitorius TaxID=93759 RepID=A0A1R3K1W5_9ROSI|nr:non-transporter ABC protein [Corchorus olitorius]